MKSHRSPENSTHYFDTIFVILRDQHVKIKAQSTDYSSNCVRLADAVGHWRIDGGSARRQLRRSPRGPRSSSSWFRLVSRAMHTRQAELPVLSLALPGAAMMRARSQSTTSSRLSSPPPMTPRNAPVEMPPPSTSIPRNSRDSWGSWGSSENGEDDMDADWTDEQRQLLITVSHTY